ncbi:MAG: hypothetical protein ACP5N1_04095 [Candidatus Woesearchaeota archaeon]
MENYDLDVNALEDLCAMLEEPAFLIDKNHIIVWANSAFKKRYDISVGANYSQLEKFEINHPSTIECLELGKLIKAVIKKNSYSIKLISLPIKYGSETISVLQLIEYFDSFETENHIVNNIVIDTHTAILKLFINNTSDATLLTDKNHVAITFNVAFDNEFIRTPEIKELILRQLDHKTAKDVYDNIKRILYHSHSILRKVLEENSHIIGYLYIFKAKNKFKSIALNKRHKNLRNTSKK